MSKTGTSSNENPEEADRIKELLKNKQDMLIKAR
jgi:hypothetical protein